MDPATNKKVQGLQKDVNNLKPFRDGRGDKSERQAEEITDTAIHMSKSNPIGFYVKYNEFATDAAKVDLTTPVGAAMDFKINPGGQTLSWASPGIMVLNYYPAVGRSTDYTSPLNRASSRFWTYLRSNQKATGKYNHQDIAMMEVCMDSGYSFHAMMRRIYGLVNSLTPTNLYYPRAILNALGVDYMEIDANLQDFRAYINSFGYQLGQYAMPKNITYFERHQWMCEGIYVDSDTTRAQTYLFVPAGYYVYDNTVSTGSQATFKSFRQPGDPLLTFEGLKAIGDSIINSIGNEEDFAYISGDLYNFYGGDVFAVPYVEENYRILPAFDKTVLSQIENCTICGELSNLNVTQDPSINRGAVIYDPYIASNRIGGNVDSIIGGNPLNFHWETVSPEDIIEATRMKAVFQKSATVGRAYDLVTCGTELVQSITIISAYNWTNGLVGSINDPAAVYQETVYDQTYLVDDVNYPNAIGRLGMVAQFDWAPLLMMTDDMNMADPHVVALSWDVDIFGFIPDSYLKNLNTACLYSQFETGTNRM